MEMQNTQNNKTILNKNNVVGGLILSTFKTYYKTIVVKTVPQWYKDRQMGQREMNRKFIKSLHLW